MPSSILSKNEELAEVAASICNDKRLNTNLDRFLKAYAQSGNDKAYEHMAGIIDAIRGSANIVADNLSGRAIQTAAKRFEKAGAELRATLDQLHQEAEINWNLNKESYRFDTSPLSELLAHTQRFVALASDTAIKRA